MKTQSFNVSARGDGYQTARTLLAGVLVAGVSLAAQAQEPNSDATAHDKQRATTAPNSPTLPDESLPSGDTKSGVLRPPDVDPKMSKPVPDIDPAMGSPPPGKAPAPEKSDPPKVQPR